MVAVADYTLPANLLINEREASLLRVLKLIKTSHGVTNQYVLRGGHSVLSDWKNDVVEELSFTWKSATQGHRIHFARAMLWWNEWLQSQSAKSMEVSQMVHAFPLLPATEQALTARFSHHPGSCEDGWRARPWSRSGTRTTRPGSRTTRLRMHRSPKPLLLLESAIARRSGTG